MKTLSLTSFILVLVFFSCTNKENQNTDDTSEKLADEKHIETSEDQELFNLIKEKDSLLFQIGFNQIDTLQAASLTSTDFEFYHDEHGVTDTKKAFVKNINGIRDLPFKTWRTLVEGSMEVYQDIGEVGMTLIRLRYKQAEEGINELLKIKKPGSRGSVIPLILFSLIRPSRQPNNSKQLVL